jgi:peptide/nickel transport system permease protein
MVPTIGIGIIIICAVFAPWIAPYNPTKNDLINNFAPPAWQEGGSWSHFLGTDKLGRDMLSRIIHGTRVSLSLSIAVIMLGGTAGTFFGLASGFLGGKTDAVVQRGVEAILALPLILVALVFMSAFGTSFTNVIFILSPFVAARFARMVRGEALVVKELDYVSLARVIGSPTHRIVLKHILPNVFNTVVVLATLEVGHLILVESSLSFLGVGIPPPRPAWGLMVADGRDFIQSHYWLTLFPGLAILASVMCLNLFGDWMRDTLDPRRRQL